MCSEKDRRIAELEAKIFKLVEGANKTALEYEERIAQLEDLAKEVWEAYRAFDVYDRSTCDRLDKVCLEAKKLLTKGGSQGGRP